VGEFWGVAFPTLFLWAFGKKNGLMEILHEGPHLHILLEEAIGEKWKKTGRRGDEIGHRT